MNQTITYPASKRSHIHATTTKTHIVWHGSLSRTNYSSGKATAVIDRWNDLSNEASTPYVIDRDGCIYRTFDDRLWAYHLNIPNGSHYEKQSIGITLANEQQLLESGGRAYCFEYIHSRNLYTGPITKTNWRGYNSFASLDGRQVDSAIELSLDICKRHNITPVFYVGNDYNTSAWKSATIFPHSAIKKDVTDLYIEPWVIEKLKAANIPVVNS